MPDGEGTGGQATALAIDYSDDELDAIADLFSRPDLGGTRVRTPPEDPLERAATRAALRAATRGLIARRAIVLEGTEAFPRVRFLEPHATVLGAFVGADATASIRIERPGQLTVRALFARDDVVVEQSSRQAQAIKRLLAQPRGTAPGLLLDGLPDSGGAAAASGATGRDLTLGVLRAAGDAVEAGADAPPGVENWLMDLLHAKTASATVIVRRRDPSGIVLAERISWLTAGALGTWRLEPIGTQPSVTVRLAPSTDERVRAAILSAWG